MLYHHPSLGYKINFVLKRLEILHTDPKELRRSSDIDVFLNSFCSWQRKFNPTSDEDIVHFDHAVILTGSFVTFNFMGAQLIYCFGGIACRFGFVCGSKKWQSEQPSGGSGSGRWDVHHHIELHN